MKNVWPKLDRNDNNAPAKRKGALLRMKVMYPASMPTFVR
jgi:hypothetical protein